MTTEQLTPEEMAQEVKRLTGLLAAAGRKDLLLRAIGVPLLEELRIEAARGELSRLVITEDYRFVLADYHVEVELQPVHKAVYLLFLAHPEGESVDKLIDPLDNAINEKCSRIKKVFLDLMDEYRASYYIIGSHTKKHIAGRVWYERLKIVTLPREMVEMRSEK